MFKSRPIALPAERSVWSVSGCRSNHLLVSRVTKERNNSHRKKNVVYLARLRLNKSPPSYVALRHPQYEASGPFLVLTMTDRQTLVRNHHAAGRRSTCT